MKAKDLLFDMISKFHQKFHSYRMKMKQKNALLHIHVLRSIYIVVSVCMTINITLFKGFFKVCKRYRCIVVP